MAVNKDTLSPKRKLVRSKIIESATVSFSQKGFEASTISEIAVSSGIADGTMYLYFHNKDDLFKTVIDETVDELLDKIRKELRDLENPIEQILKYFDVSIKELTRKPEIAKMITVDLHHIRGLSSHRLSHQVYDKQIKFIDSLCSNAIDKGYIRKVDSITLANMIYASIDHTIRVWIYSDYKTDLSSIKKKMLNIFVYGFVKY